MVFQYLERMLKIYDVVELRKNFLERVGCAAFLDKRRNAQAQERANKVSLYKAIEWGLIWNDLRE